MLAKHYKTALFFGLLLVGSAYLVFGNNNSASSASVKRGETGIRFFKGSWDDVLNESKKTGKPIFMDVYTTWFGPCRYMIANIFTQESVGKYYNENYICYKVDAERGEGRMIARMFHVQAYPTFLYVDNKGELIHRHAGALQAEGFIELGQKVQEMKK